MKLKQGITMLKKSLYMICTASLLSAATTMCYKKDHLDPSTIENTSLEGGKCAGKRSVTDMKKDGYIVDSMKLQNGTDGLNYIYVFEKKHLNTPVYSNKTVTDAQLTAQIEKIQKTKELQKVTDKAVDSLEDGKRVYETTCKSCHGDGTISAYNTARPLKSLTLEEMQISIREYSNGGKDNGMAILMIPYATSITSNELKAVYNYLHTVK
jgi:cytochrome c553